MDVNLLSWPEPLIIAMLCIGSIALGYCMAMGIDVVRCLIILFCRSLNRLSLEEPGHFDPAGDELGEPQPPCPPPSRRTSR